MTTFIDKDNGAEYEEVYPNSDPKVFENIVIRPIKSKPKWEVTNDCGVGWARIIVRFESHIPEVQAQLIKDKIERLLKEYFDE